MLRVSDCWSSDAHTQNTRTNWKFNRDELTKTSLNMLLKIIKHYSDVTNKHIIHVTNRPIPSLLCDRQTVMTAQRGHGKRSLCHIMQLLWLVLLCDLWPLESQAVNEVQVVAIKTRRQEPHLGGRAMERELPSGYEREIHNADVISANQITEWGLPMRTSAVGYIRMIEENDGVHLFIADDNSHTGSCAAVIYCLNCIS